MVALIKMVYDERRFDAVADVLLAGHPCAVGRATRDHGPHARQSHGQFPRHHGLVRAAGPGHRDARQRRQRSQRIHGHVRAGEREGAVDLPLGPRPTLIPFLQVKRLENVAGWYHSHPGYGCWLSGIDVDTQMNNQKFQDPFVAVVVRRRLLCRPLAAYFRSDRPQQDDLCRQGRHRRIPHVSQGLHASECLLLGVPVHTAPQDRRFWCPCEPILFPRRPGLQVES